MKCNCGSLRDCQNRFSLQKYELGKIDLWMSKTPLEEGGSPIETGVTIGPAEARQLASELLRWAEDLDKEIATGKQYWEGDDDVR